jgi:CRISPR-associated protein (TIGR03986 family)
MPRHMNPTRPDRTATAPYNFVPLPERVFDVADGIQVDDERIKPWETHDRFVPGTHSGSIELTIETLTPLFIRGAVCQRQDGAWDDRDSRLRPEPYTTPDGRPAIPGSSLRGMLRTLVEILSFSKIQPVSDGKPFFRTVADDRIGRTYRARMTAAGGKPRGGVLRLNESGAAIELREVVRVRRDALRDIKFNRNPNYTPPWPQQHSRCWVRVGDPAPDVREIRLQEQPPTGSGWRAARLVLSGNAPRKTREFVFLEPEGASPSKVIRVPERILARFHDDDQITQWQEAAFPRNQPHGGGRRAPGHLRDGEPVFFVVDGNATSADNPDGLVFLGRAGMFRFPYDRSPEDLVAQSLRDARLDLAEAMFGKADPSATIKGRVYFDDAIATNGGLTWCEPVIVPQILSAPKPTTFQHYLTQDGTKEKDQLTTYIDDDHTTIRGHKLYWHRWDDCCGVCQVKEAPDTHDVLRNSLQSPNPKDTQHTIIRPVKAGVTFVGRVRFENLTDVELGALLHALQLPDGCAHRLGMGKPLGLGSIRITARLSLVDRAERYREWKSTGILENEDGSRFRQIFEDTIISHAKDTGEVLLNGQRGLRKIARLDALFRMLEWERRPARESTAYMELDQFRERPVLPTPHHVAGANEPGWPSDPPRPAAGAHDGSGTRSGRFERALDRPNTTPYARSHSRTVPPTVPAPKPVQKGQTRVGTLKRSDGKWVAVFDGEPREAQVINPDKIDTSCPEGATAEFYITEQSKNAGIKCRFERMTKGPKSAS